MSKIVKINKAKRNVVTFRLSDEENEIINEICKHTKMKRSQLIRFLVHEALFHIHGIKFGGGKDDREI